MSSFRESAIEVLSKSSKPLHYENITKEALKLNLLETDGLNPARTMISIISMDIKKNKTKSIFLRTGPGKFKINPRYTETHIIDNNFDLENSLSGIKNHYLGKFGEHRVLSELLLREYNSSIMSVDEGIDIVAIKEEKQYSIQVKTSNARNGKYIADISVSSYQRHNHSNTFYIFVLMGKKIHFLILPYHELRKNIKEGNVAVIDRGKKYRCTITISGNIVYLGGKGHDISYHKDDWESIK
ncbi:MAG: HTH domain-containing protein [Pirellulales bacterium]|nr:HTH domain-containing protein [Pirellulales bacterium]